MGAPRRKNLIRSRRRVADDREEEEEEGSVAAGLEEDSLSEGSAISDADEDADAEGSDGDDVDASTKDTSKAAPIANGHKSNSDGSGVQMGTTSTKPSFTVQMADTEAMMNGLRVSGEEDEGVAFENIGDSAEVQLPGEVLQEPTETSNAVSLAEKRRREHEEYRKKRDADPAFVPNRGGFFMHDHRSAAPGQNGFRPFLRGRGRGRGISRGPYQPSRYVFNNSVPCTSHTMLNVQQPDFGSYRFSLGS